jgi:hypothetical protein
MLVGEGMEGGGGVGLRMKDCESSRPQVLPTPLFFATLKALEGRIFMTNVGYRPSTSLRSSREALQAV